MARPCPVELLAVAGAYAELVYASVAYDVVAAAQHAGVGELYAEVVLAQVGVGVEVYDVHVGEDLMHLAEGTERHEVLAAYHEGCLAVGEYLCRVLRYGVECRLCRAHGQFEVAAVEDADVLQRAVEVWRVRLQSVRLVAHCRTAEACAGAVAGGGVEGCAEEDHLCFLIVCLAAYEGFDVSVYHIFSPPVWSSTLASMRSTYAGRAKHPRCRFVV